jgi:MYXO-CTERM domain-containing protein
VAIREASALARVTRFVCVPNPGGHIRVFGVSLLAVAAFAAAGLWLRRRREQLLTHATAYRLGELDGLRAAGL